MKCGDHRKETLRLIAANDPKLIEAGWRSLIAGGLLKNIPGKDHYFLRLLFFSGARFLFEAILDLCDPDNDRDDEAITGGAELLRAEFDALSQELRARQPPKGHA